jgi:acetyltransferase-like isoleucine patch superfamily enzyme
MLKKIYLSPFGLFISFVMNVAGFLHRPFMIYGFYNRCKGKFYKHTRISSTATIIGKDKLDIDDNIWVWHYSIIDASNGIKIGMGSQIGAWVGIFTHGSHLAIRLLGERYIEFDKDKRIGYKRGSVEIGEYTFIGAQSLIMPNVRIGKGCLIAARSLVSKSIPDYAIVSGNPAEIIGDTRELDRKYFDQDIVQKLYYDRDVIEMYLAKKRAWEQDDSDGD